jgi:DNA invertase Pin-like site-specific DNA recombinase
MKIGYIRVSTESQNLDLQKDELINFGCDKIFEDKISGSLSKAQRSGLKSAIEYARTGDVLVVWKLDRLGRNIKDLIEIINELNVKGVGFKTITGDIDTTTASGKLIFHIFAALSEFERELIRERTNAGLKSARARGRVGGRPSKINADKIRMAKQLHADTNSKIADILKALDVKKGVFYKMLKM